MWVRHRSALLNIINNDALQEFNVYPNGTMEQLLRVNETIDLTVSHTPIDATADLLIYKSFIQENLV